jgi:OOP family OmpA-OmpF porin
MKTRYFKLLFFVPMSIIISGCGAKTPVEKPASQFQAVDFNPQVRAGEYEQKVDNFIVILDTSGSMAEPYKGEVKLNIAREIVSRLNATLPDLKLKGELRMFGRISTFSQQFTQILWGPASYSKSGLDGGLQKVERGRGESPLNLAINAAAGDLGSFQGKTAVIIITDANNEYMNYGAAVNAAKSLKGQYGDNLCIYTVQIGKDPDAKKVLDQVAEVGQCGVATNAEQISSSGGMAAFVEQVFLTKVEKVEVVIEEVVVVKIPVVKKPVVKAPVRGDRDGDGVYDDLDQCPNTPKGAKVDERGCWVLGGVFFDFDKYNIKSQYNPELIQVAIVLQDNPSVAVEIQGHTDDIGTAGYNKKLSKQRADSVMNYLVNLGIDKKRLSAKGYGLSRPIASNLTKRGRAMNRRVELTPVP